MGSSPNIIRCRDSKKSRYNYDLDSRGALTFWGSLTVMYIPRSKEWLECFQFMIPGAFMKYFKSQ